MDWTQEATSGPLVSAPCRVSPTSLLIGARRDLLRLSRIDDGADGRTTGSGTEAAPPSRRSCGSGYENSLPRLQGVSGPHPPSKQSRGAREPRSSATGERDGGTTPQRAVEVCGGRYRRQLWAGGQPVAFLAHRAAITDIPACCFAGGVQSNPYPTKPEPVCLAGLTSVALSVEVPSYVASWSLTSQSLRKQVKKDKTRRAGGLAKCSL